MIDVTYEITDGFVKIPLKDFYKMKERLESFYDELALEKALQTIEEFFPEEVMDRLINRTETPLKVYREYRQMSQIDLSKKTGISQNIISGIENGKRKGTVENYKAFAEALDVDLEQLV